MVEDRGVKMWWVPALIELTPAEMELWSGQRRVAYWKIAPTINAYPVTLVLPPLNGSANYRLTCRRAYRGSPRWSLSQVEFLE